jgi:hypothetical protein
MLAPFFTLATVSPSRQRGLRNAVAAHVALVGCAILALLHLSPKAGLLAFGNLLLVEGRRWSAGG